MIGVLLGVDGLHRGSHLAMRAIPVSGRSPAQRRVIRRCGEEIGIVAGDGLQHFGYEAVIGGETPANLGDEHLEAFAAEQAGRLLLALRQRRGDHQEVADKQRQGLGDDGDVAIDDTNDPVQLVETPDMVPELKAYAAYVLARAAAADTKPEQDGFDAKALVDQLWGRRSDISPYGQAWLMLALHTGKDARAGELAGILAHEITLSDTLRRWIDGFAHIMPGLVTRSHAEIWEPRVKHGPIALAREAKARLDWAAGVRGSIDSTLAFTRDPRRLANADEQHCLG